MKGADWVKSNVCQRVEVCPTLVGVFCQETKHKGSPFVPGCCFVVVG